jgi:hypothetical protein
VCDPIDEPELYLRIADESGIKIRYVVDTHVQADHISGGRRLAEMAGAKYVLHTSSGTAYRFFPVEDGDNLDLAKIYKLPWCSRAIQDAQHRDLGYAVGALISGIIADLLGMRAAIQVVAVLTLLSGLHVAIRMRETLVQHPATGRGEVL